METAYPQTPLQQDCLDKLGRVLDLVLKTAEAAGAENNHKVVIQSAREVTRIVALIHKMTGSTAKSGRSPRPGQSDAKAADPCPSAKQSSPQPEPAAGNHVAAGKTDLNPDDLMLPDLETLLTPRDPAYWDDVPGDFFQKFSNNQELQSIEKEVADFLRDTNRKSDPSSSRTPEPAKS